MNNTIKYLRQIAAHMTKAADHLADAANLQSMLEDGPPSEVWQARVDAEACERAKHKLRRDLADASAEPNRSESGKVVVGHLGGRLYLSEREADELGVEPMETIGDVVVEPAGEKHPTIGTALDRCRDVLGWDPDTLSSVDACSAIAELMTFDELDSAEALEKLRGDMTPRKASRSTVLAAIAKRRAELEAAGVQS